MSSQLQIIKEKLNDLKIKVDTQNDAIKIFIKDKLIHSQRLYKIEYKNKVNIIKQILSFFGL